ncbi:Hsp70 family protein [Devosia nitrariae]|uniref:Heat-shock protein n=1 Tax=Devosia nitrariae TaxID=2071872 RepID=A0ABQ5W537_9HYPH|nr:Hsp70 family protein [Devosia nitrariae]GLQ55050.1 heat-shock protein [Devosia nitrariae]
MTRACGFDFGTSNSTLGFADPNGPRLLPLEADKVTIPSVIFFSFEDDATYYGRAAIGHYVSGGEGRLMRSLKSVLGTSLIGEAARVKKNTFGFLDILGFFIGEMKRRAEAAAGKALESVVVGRPVRFVDDDAAADGKAQAQLEQAVRAQGFAHVEFQFEPIAAALDYERQVVDEHLALIVDLGGGTSDFSLVRVSPERRNLADRNADILATAGVHIGGTDFDRLLAMARVMPELGLGTTTRDGKRYLPTAPYYNLSTWHRINWLYSAEARRELASTRREAERPDLVDKMIAIVEERAGHRLVGAVEEAKIVLSDASEHTLRFAARHAAIETRMHIEHLTTAIADAVDRVAGTADETLRQAGIGRGEVDALILTGGSTQVPAILARLTAMFPQADLVRTDVLGSVGMGLAIESARRFGT